MASQKRSKWASDEECREFLIAVANKRPGSVQRYEGWFPCQIPQDEDEYDFLLSLYRRLVRVWVHSQVPLSEAPKNATDLYVLLLCHKLRVVWERALGHQNPAAAARRLWVETREIEHEFHAIFRSKWRNEFLHRRVRPSRTESHDELLLRFHRIDQVMQWLQENTHKLMKCALPDCRRHLYCIREKPHQKYCSQVCAALAESKRVSQRFTQKATRNSRLSPEGRARIVAGQKKRWDEYRKRMKSP